MTLIDSPGFNDAEISRTDKNILIELVQTIRPRLYDKNFGINTLIQCVMPDSSDRLRESSLKAMNHVLFTLNSLHPKADIKNHPKFIVIFNDVSLYDTVSLDKLD